MLAIPLLALLAAPSAMPLVEQGNTFDPGGNAVAGPVVGNTGNGTPDFLAYVFTAHQSQIVARVGISVAVGSSHQFYFAIVPVEPDGGIPANLPDDGLALLGNPLFQGTPGSVGTGSTFPTTWVRSRRPWRPVSCTR